MKDVVYGVVAGNVLYLATAEIIPVGKYVRLFFINILLLFCQFVELTLF
jgi:hypothetical protein